MKRRTEQPWNICGWLFLSAVMFWWFVMFVESLG